MNEIYLCDGIQYHPVLDDELTLYLVSIPHLDKEWKSGSEMHIPEGKGCPSKKASVAAWISEGYPVCPPEVKLVTGGIMVVDGRHRLSTIRDMGKKAIVISSKYNLHYIWAKKIAP